MVPAISFRAVNSGLRYRSGSCSSTLFDFHHSTCVFLQTHQAAEVERPVYCSFKRLEISSCFALSCTWMDSVPWPVSGRQGGEFTCRIVTAAAILPNLFVTAVHEEAPFSYRKQVREAEAERNERSRWNMYTCLWSRQAINDCLLPAEEA